MNDSQTLASRTRFMNDQFAILQERKHPLENRVPPPLVAVLIGAAMGLVAWLTPVVEIASNVRFVGGGIENRCEVASECILSPSPRPPNCAIPATGECEESRLFEPRTRRLRFEVLLHQLNLPRSPSLLVERLQRAVEPQKRVPALAGDGLHPILLLAIRCFRTEVHIH